MRRDLAELRNAADTLLYMTDQSLEGYQNLVDAESLQKAKAIANELRARLAEQGNTSAIRDAYQRLEAVTFAIAEQLYAPPEGSSTDAPDPAALDPEDVG
jgi:molecular chaperone DnaK